MKGLCDCRNLSETEAKEAIIEALNRLPVHKGQLLRLPAQIRNEKLKPIDALKTQSKKQEGQSMPIVSRTGRIITFDDAMVIRFLDTLTVCDDGCEINFKGGIQMKMYR